MGPASSPGPQVRVPPSSLLLAVCPGPAHLPKLLPPSPKPRSPVPHESLPTGFLPRHPPTPLPASELSVLSAPLPPNLTYFSNATLPLRLLRLPPAAGLPASSCPRARGPRAACSPREPRSVPLRSLRPALHAAWHPGNNRSVIVVVTLRPRSKWFPPPSLFWLTPPNSNPPPIPPKSALRHGNFSGAISQGGLAVPLEREGVLAFGAPGGTWRLPIRALTRGPTTLLHPKPRVRETAGALGLHTCPVPG